jgi:hypothetical protein
MSAPELEPKKVVSITPVADGFDVILECGHKSTWMVVPPVETAGCPDCVNEYIAAHKPKEPVQ